MQTDTTRTMSKQQVYMDLQQVTIVFPNGSHLFVPIEEGQNSFDAAINSLKEMKSMANSNWLGPDPVKMK